MGLMECHRTQDKEGIQNRRDKSPKRCRLAHKRRSHTFAVACFFLPPNGAHKWGEGEISSESVLENDFINLLGHPPPRHRRRFFKI